MDVSCDLEVDVNGEEIFIVSKVNSVFSCFVLVITIFVLPLPSVIFFVICIVCFHLGLIREKIISSYSGRISKLFGKTRGVRENLKVIFHDFPGGAKGFELMTRFCYNGGKIEINPFNLPILHSIAHFMEMEKHVSGNINLLKQTEKSFEEISHYTWSELLETLKQCQYLLPCANSSAVLQKSLEFLVGRLALASETSRCPSTSSSDSSGFRLSSDAGTRSLKNSFIQTTWWFEDLAGLSPDLVEIVIKSLVSQKFDHHVVSRFLFYYHKSRFITSVSAEKCKITETVIDMLYSLDWSVISCRCLFGILRAALSLGIRNCFRSKLESMIGSQMDQVTLDNLLIRCPTGMDCLYDVNLVLRFLKSFLSRRMSHLLPVQLKKVASLMDLYIAEVAPDRSLKPSEFLALLRALPDSARDSYDGIYRAVDMYLEAHAGLSEEEKMDICHELNCEKLSTEARVHLARSGRVSTKCSVQALVPQQDKLQSLLQDPGQPKTLNESPCKIMEINCKGKKDGACSERMVLYSGDFELSTENAKLRAHLLGMQWRVLRLKKVREKLQTQVTKILRSRLSSQNKARSLPRLCS